MQFQKNNQELGMPDYATSQMFGGVNKADIDFNSLAKTLDCSRNFYNVGIIYDDGKRRYLVRSSKRLLSNINNDVSHIIVTKVNSVSQQEATSAITKTLQTSSLATEIASTALSCGAILVTVLLAVGSSAAIPLTAGGSGVITAMIVSGGLATAAQCAIGTSRLIAMHTGHNDQLTWLDSQEWYNTTCTLLDVISLAGAAAGLKGTIETYKLMKSVSSAKAIDWLKNLSRSERTRITQEIIRIQNPGISGAGIKAAIKLGRYPKRFPSEALQNSLQRELINALVNTSAFAGSAMTGTIRHPGNIVQSGRYAIGLLQSFSITKSTQ